MKNTSSLIAKKEIIESYKGNDFIENALYYTYNPYLKYYVTSKSIEKNIQICDMNCIYDNIWDLLDALDNMDVIKSGGKVVWIDTGAGKGGHITGATLSENGEFLGTVEFK